MSNSQQNFNRFRSRLYYLKLLFIALLRTFLRVLLMHGEIMIVAEFVTV